MKPLVALATLFLLPAAAPPVAVASGTLYVAPWGDDASACSFDAPCLTLARASSLAGPGTVVYARGGTYDVLAEQDLRAVGSEAAPVTFAAYPGETPLLDGTDALLGPWEALVRIVQSRHVVFSGFEVCCSPERGIVVAESESVTVSGNTVRDVQDLAIGGAGDRITIANNVVDRAVLRNGARTASGGWSSAIGSGPRWDGSPSTDWTIARNVVTRSYGECLNAYMVIGFTMEGNYADGCYNVALYIDRSRNGRVEGNVLMATIPGFERLDSGWSAVGILLAAEQGPYAITPGDVAIRGNAIGGGVQMGVAWWQDPSNAEPWNTYERIRIEGNRIVGVASHAVRFPPAGMGAAPPCCSTFLFNVVSGPTEFGDPAAWTVFGNRPPSRPLRTPPS